ncbi:hypothetical protein CCAN12_780003 [Capnocytophaga canimorsus]|uniref:Uncharacterized protein n=1 Tax=Capnocytophaga canimorsus TaxID=28188 RepID=A0A0B7IE37_9FLAO|nr:hypothetical protein CCAN12_780003 [Capnocytophaga canimorsus]CEN50035.1 hypothetical protein CCAN2_2020053 [Capnocytophaga canimorsus]
MFFKIIALLFFGRLSNNRYLRRIELDSVSYKISVICITIKQILFYEEKYFFNNLCFCFGCSGV